MKIDWHPVVSWDRRWKTIPGTCLLLYTDKLHDISYYCLFLNSFTSSIYCHGWCQGLWSFWCWSISILTLSHGESSAKSVAEEWHRGRTRRSGISRCSCVLYLSLPAATTQSRSREARLVILDKCASRRLLCDLYHATIFPTIAKAIFKIVSFIHFFLFY